MYVYIMCVCVCIYIYIYIISLTEYRYLKLKVLTLISYIYIFNKSCFANVHYLFVRLLVVNPKITLHQKLLCNCGLKVWCCRRCTKYYG